MLLDSLILEDAHRFKIDLVPRLEGVLQGKVKPMITQCCMRHLYNAKPKNEALITEAKGYERRRCNHHELENPLSSLECLSEVVDLKGSLTNKHRYVVASQDTEVRAHMRRIAGVPLVYISKSVMIMEPMNEVTEEQREREERSKFRAGLKGQRNPGTGEKRKRENDEGRQDGGSIDAHATGDARPQKNKKRKGPKEPNPLSVKKSQKTQAPQAASTAISKLPDPDTAKAPTADAPNAPHLDGEGPAPRKRKRKHKSKGDSSQASQADVAAAIP